jgi:hypothetical protein
MQGWRVGKIAHDVRLVRQARDSSVYLGWCGVEGNVRFVARAMCKRG